MAGLLVLAHENICQISSRGPVFRPQVKGLHECFFLFLCFLLLSLLSRQSSRQIIRLYTQINCNHKIMLIRVMKRFITL